MTEKEFGEVFDFWWNKWDYEIKLIFDVRENPTFALVRRDLRETVLNIIDYTGTIHLPGRLYESNLMTVLPCINFNEFVELMCNRCEKMHEEFKDKTTFFLV